MKISSFDIFDTCLIRKCGEPQNVLDILSYRVFNAPVTEENRKEFIMARRMADINTYENVTATLMDIYEAMPFTHPSLKPLNELTITEQEVEHDMLIAEPNIAELIEKIRANGHQIIYISDMYLPSEFLKRILTEQSLFKNGDKLYVSCEAGKRKADGSLFKYIKEKENIKYNEWTHYGDNEKSDYDIPRSLGIRCKKINIGYTPYQQLWINNVTTPQNRVPETLAGVCRTLTHILPESNHRDFLVDIASPLFVSYTYRVLKKAHEEGIKRLYFCARDAHIIYYIAETMMSYFPDISIHYLYISRDALYKGNPIARMKYFEQCGLASQADKCAIVDLRTSGKTLCVLNNQLESNGYLAVKGFFFEIFCTGNLENIPSDYYAELMTPYYIQKPSCSRIFLHHYLVEMYVSVHNEQRTVDYIDNGKGLMTPVFAQEQTEFSEDSSSMPNLKQRCLEHREALLAFANLFMTSGLNRYVDEVFNLAMQTWVSFSNQPEVHYLPALTDFYSSKPNSDVLLPYVKKMNIFELIKTHGKNTIWKRASIIYSLSPVLAKWYQKKR